MGVEMIFLWLLQYFIVIVIVGVGLSVFFGWITYCDPADDIKTLMAFIRKQSSRLLAFVRKRSWER
jgi:hypothetical protein